MTDTRYPPLHRWTVEVFEMILKTNHPWLQEIVAGLWLMRLKKGEAAMREFILTTAARGRERFFANSGMI